MRLRAASAVCVKDWKEMLRSPHAVAALLVLPVLVAVLLPFAAVGLEGASEPALARLAPLVSGLADRSVVPAWSDAQKVSYALLVYLFAPIFLLVPVVVSSVTAAHSFAGEKEQRTIEALLYTPISDAELVAAKLAASFLPSFAITMVCFAAYTAVVHLVAHRTLGEIVFPTPAWWVLVLWFSPALALLCLAAVVFVSQRARTAWGAQQISALVVLPLVGVAANQATLLMLLRPGAVFAAGAALFAADALALRWVVRSLDRERLVTRFA